MKALCAAGLALIGATFSTAAAASDARIELRAYVPTRCQMTFAPNLQIGVDNTVSFGSVTQFCNTRFQMRVAHAVTTPGVELRLGSASAIMSGSQTLIEPAGDPINATTQLSARNITPAAAVPLGTSLVMMVTPIAF